MQWLNSKTRGEDEAWIFVSDMMAGLMMIFLFISIIYIRDIGQYFTAVSSTQDRICNDLNQEFRHEKEQWKMAICEDGLLIRFDNDAVFKQSSPFISEKFKTILDSFYPRLMSIVWQHKDSVSELRIEGHTSKEGRKGDNDRTAYLYNTQLSQKRSFNVMDYALKIRSVLSNKKYLEWSYSNLTAHGMSSSELIMENGKENQEKSRRVEFRLRTKAEDKLRDLVNEVQNGGT